MNNISCNIWNISFSGAFGHGKQISYSLERSTTKRLYCLRESTGFLNYRCLQVVYWFATFEFGRQDSAVPKPSSKQKFQWYRAHTTGVNSLLYWFTLPLYFAIWGVKSHWKLYTQQAGSNATGTYAICRTQCQKQSNTIDHKRIAQGHKLPTTCKPNAWMKGVKQTCS